MSTTTLLATSPSITYSPNAWTNEGGLMTTLIEGATAEFSFDGVFVQVLGSVQSKSKRHPAPVSTYTLDGITSAPFNPTDIMGKQTANNQGFYQSPNLASGNHSLVIKAISIASGAQFILDSIVIGSDFSPASSGLPIVPTTGFSLSLPTASSSSASPVGAASSSRKTNVGGIVGGVLAALIIIAAILASLMFLRRRKQKAEKENQPAVTPFISERNGYGSSLPSPAYTPPNRDSYGSQARLYNSRDSKEPLPPGPSRLSHHGSMYKPKNDRNGLPPLEFGYGKGL
jgi:hypothetical protein